MKKFLVLTSLICALLFSGCNMCAGATAMNVYSPWGRSNVLEISTYAVQAERPTDEELDGFNIGYFITGSGEYTSKITSELDENNRQVLVIENTFRFTGQYFPADSPDSAVTPVTDTFGDGTNGWEADGTFHDSYTARTVIDGLSENTMNSRSSTKTASVTLPKRNSDGNWYLARADYVQTIDYGDTQATARVTNTDLSAQLTEEEISAMYCGSNQAFEMTYSYGADDLVYDNESFAAALRAYSVNAAFGSGSVTPTSFKVLNPRVNALVDMRFTVSTNEDYTQSQFHADTRASVDGDGTLIYDAEKITNVVGAEIYEVSLSLQSGSSGQPKVYRILKTQSTEEKQSAFADWEVQYTTDSGAGSPIFISPVLFIEDDMNMNYRLTQYVNATPKS